MERRRKKSPRKKSPEPLEMYLKNNVTPSGYATGGQSSTNQLSKITIKKPKKIKKKVSAIENLVKSQVSTPIKPSEK